ncbi:MAG: iron-sulfur flavoprotein [Herbinix sp.]|jgi:multimeric flavodoxin WrbA|nr:iron-sulfur flavoprotein [Herbinix sp.]
MKVILINGSPRKNWNTHKLLMEAERGAKEAGAETEIIHLFDLKYTDCISCFACKVRGNKTDGVCAVRDELKPVLEKIAGADAVIIGSPIYYGNLTGQALSFINRLLFPVMHYEIDLQTGKPEKILQKEKKCGLIATMNASEEYVQNGYGKTMESIAGSIGMVLGSCEILYSCDTYQFKDYSKYYAGMWDENKKAEHREQQFPVDMKNAYELGKRLVM